MIAPAFALAALQNLRDDLRANLFERDAEIDCMLTALVAGEHILLLGPPGTAKSALSNALSSALSGRNFTRLFTRFTTPEEVFGPYSLSGIKADRYERVIDGYLPTADVAFLDEVFKANSAILNALLTVLNERVFDNGTKRIGVPLEIAIGASNELPEDESLAALYDRFVLRRWVKPIGNRDNMRALLSGAGKPKITAQLGADDLATLRALADAAPVPAAVLDMILDLREKLAQDVGVEVSDRRWVKAVRLLRAHAVLEGRLEVAADDLEILADTLWDKPDDRPAVYGAILGVISPGAAKAMELRDAAFEAFGKINLTDKAAKIDDWASANATIRKIADTVAELGMTDARVARVHVELTDWSKQIGRAVSVRLAGK